MKKALLVLGSLLFLSTFVRAQVISNFNMAGSTSGFETSNDISFKVDSVYQMTDPNNSSNGVLAVPLNFAAPNDTVTNLHARIDYGKVPDGAVYISANNAQFLTFWVYLPSSQNWPDSLQINPYAMNNGNLGGSWDWKEDVHYAVDIPKDVWYPLSFPLAKYGVTDSNFFCGRKNSTGTFMFGLQMYPNANYHNYVFYVDNVALIGAAPHLVQSAANFNTAGNTGGFETSNDISFKVDSVYQMTDPNNSSNGVLAVPLNFAAPNDTVTNLHARIDYGKVPDGAVYISANNAQFLTFWVYLPSSQNWPDSLQINPYAMNNGNLGGSWDWKEDVHYAVDIPKDVWYPLSFPLAKYGVTDSNFFCGRKNSTGTFMFGLQMYPNANYHNYVFYVDDVALVDEETNAPPPVWVAANFEKTSPNGKEGFYVPSYANGKLSNIWDQVTPNGSNVLQAAVDFGAAPHMFAVIRDTIPMYKADSVATGISFQVYLPTKMSTGGFVQFFVSGGASDSVSIVDTIGTASMRPGQWNTMWINKLDSLNTAGKFDASTPASIGVKVWYPGDTATWSGNILLDNLTIYGIWFPDQIADPVRENNIVKTFKLYDNFPNPFNPSTMIQYDVPKTSQVVLSVYDILGREVETIVNAKQAAGTYKINLNMSKFASGVYFLRMNAGSYLKIQKMMLLK